MATVKAVCDFFEELVPGSLKMDFDNVGLLVGTLEAQVTRALVALDITDEVIAEAAEKGAELIVSHHPLFFELKSVRDSDSSGRKVISLIKNGISCICLHTNLDVVADGLNDELIKVLGAENMGIIQETGIAPDGLSCGLGRFGEMPSDMAFSDFLGHVKTALNANGLRYYDAGRPARRIAVCGGSGGDLLSAAIAGGCDTYVTAELKHNMFLDAAEAGINLIDAGHFCTENVCVPLLAEHLKRGFDELEVLISQRHGQPTQFV